MAIVGQFDKAGEGDRRPKGVVGNAKNARNLGNDLIRYVVIGIFHIKYPIIYPFKAVSFDIDLLQL